MDLYNNRSIVDAFEGAAPISAIKELFLDFYRLREPQRMRQRQQWTQQRQQWRRLLARLDEQRVQLGQQLKGQMEEQLRGRLRQLCQVEQQLKESGAVLL